MTDPIPTVLGLDLSLTGTGLVAIPGDWNGDWDRIERRTVGRPLKRDASVSEQIDRLGYLCDSVLSFVTLTSPTLAVIEEYSFTSANSRAHALGELGGVVKLDLWRRCRLPVSTVAASTARKLILGKLPKRDVKAVTRGALTAMGMPTDWGEDEADAFVGANWAMSALGGYALIVDGSVRREAG